MPKVVNVPSRLVAGIVSRNPPLSVEVYLVTKYEPITSVREDPIGTIEDVKSPTGYIRRVQINTEIGLMVKHPDTRVRLRIPFNESNS